MSRWDDNKTPVRRFNPFPFTVLLIGLAVFLIISLGHLID